jgi:imidazole glycerol-phosphate synthase subunit HisH
VRLPKLQVWKLEIMSGSKVTLIDYGVGNLLSVQRGLEYCGATVHLSSDPEEILASSKVVLPGVGAYGRAMEELYRLDLVKTLRELAFRNTPLLGICLGMQLLLDESEEFGNTPGLGLIPGRVVPVPSEGEGGELLKLPHIGWSALLNSGDGWANSILRNNHEGDAAYFVHSFMAVPDNSKHRIADCVNGGRRIAATIKHGNITGCQFHPEKSGYVGLKMLRSFCVD